jgi:hypothetical protein
VVDAVTAALQAQHALLAGGTPEARLLEEVLLLLLLVVRRGAGGQVVTRGGRGRGRGVAGGGSGKGMACVAGPVLPWTCLVPWQT